MPELGRTILILGIVLVVAGSAIILLGRTGLPIGRLPGDITYRGKNTTVYFPSSPALGSASSSRCSPGSSGTSANNQRTRRYRKALQAVIPPLSLPGTFSAFSKWSERMCLRRLVLSGLLAFIFVFVANQPIHAAAVAAPQNTTSDPAAEHLSADAQRISTGGATFTVPAGWSIKTDKDKVVLAPPEPDMHVAIIDTKAADARAAVAAAWTIYKPDAKRPLKLVTPRPAREGWDERQVFDYETSPNERATVQAVAYRAGSNWTVLILDGSDMTAEKRSAPIGLI